MPSPIQRSSAGSVPASNGATSTTRGLTAALAKRTPTRQLSQLSEPRLVDAKVAKLLCIRYHQPCQLRANHAFLPPLADADQVNPLLLGLEPPTVAAGADLLQIDDAPLTVGRHDAHLGVEEVDELALAVDGVHDHLAGSVVPGHDGGGVAPRAAAQRPACELGPELVEVGPAH